MPEVALSGKGATDQGKSRDQGCDTSKSLRYVLLRSTSVRRPFEKSADEEAIQDEKHTTRDLKMTRRSGTRILFLGPLYGSRSSLSNRLELAASESELA